MQIWVKKRKNNPESLWHFGPFYFRTLSSTVLPRMQPEPSPAREERTPKSNGEYLQQPKKTRQKSSPTEIDWVQPVSPDTRRHRTRSRETEASSCQSCNMKVRPLKLRPCLKNVLQWRSNKKMLPAVAQLLTVKRQEDIHEEWRENNGQNI